jgi:hypothetical protein
MAQSLGQHFYDKKRQILFVPLPLEPKFLSNRFRGLSLEYSDHSVKLTTCLIPITLIRCASHPRHHAFLARCSDTTKTSPTLSSDILRRDTWQFNQFKLSSLTCVALAWKRNEETGHAATHIITLCI